MRRRISVYRGPFQWADTSWGILCACGREVLVTVEPQACGCGRLYAPSWVMTLFEPLEEGG